MSGGMADEALSCPKWSDNQMSVQGKKKKEAGLICGELLGGVGAWIVTAI
jgi:hypothetical protein